MTLDDLVAIHLSKALETEVPDTRAGIRAVVEALRDELSFWTNDCHACDRANDTINEILGSDAGSEKAAGGVSSNARALTCGDTAPAAAPTCEWTWMVDHYSPACSPKEKAFWKHNECPLCCKPITFKESM